MTAFLLGTALFIGLLIIVGLHRVGVGPTVFDRVVAVALVAANGMVLLVLVSFLFDRVDMFVDIVLSYAVFAFVLPVTLGKYFARKEKP